MVESNSDDFSERHKDTFVNLVRSRFTFYPAKRKIIIQSDSTELFTRDSNWEQLSPLVTKAIEICVDRDI